MNVQELFRKVSENLKSGGTVALISIPLSVSLAVASQTSPVAGVVTAIWAGLIAALFGGSNYNIVGPTGALSGILAMYAISNGADTLPVLAITSGIIILIAYALRFERFLVFVPGSTIQGFTLGVAFIIALNQLNAALGISVANVHEAFIDNVFESLVHIQSASLSTFLVFITFFLGLLLLAKYVPKIPGAILLAPLGIILGILTSQDILPFQLTTLGAKFPEIAPAVYVPYSIKISGGTISAAMTIALVAILETMISAKIADGMTKTKHNGRKEMLGLGLANVFSGLFGGIPATAALARTSLNIKSGATDKMSAVISSIFVMVISFLLLSTFKYIPMAVIAAILVFVAVRMVEVDHITHMYRNDKNAFLLTLLVAAITVYKDPIIGILLGTAIALVLFMYTLSRGQYDLIVNNPKQKHHLRISHEELTKLDKEAHTLVYTIRGQLAYINSQAHVSRFEHRLNGTKHLVLRLRELYFVDHDGVAALDQIFEICRKHNREVYITGVSDSVRSQLRHSDDFRALESEGKVMEKTSMVLKKLGYDVTK